MTSFIADAEYKLKYELKTFEMKNHHQQVDT